MKRFLVFLTVTALIGFASSTFAQQPRSGAWYRSTVSLLLIEEVQTELKLTAEQKEKLQAQGFDQNASREDRWQLAKKLDETIKTVLDETQQKRLEELRIQHDGAYSLTRSDVAQKLGLDQPQKDKIQRLRRELYGFDFRTATEEERRKYLEYRERKEKLNTDLLGVLTEAQKEAFEKMQGEKFTFPDRRRNNNN
jgi:hypothetical protein